MIVAHTRYDPVTEILSDFAAGVLRALSAESNVVEVGCATAANLEAWVKEHTGSKVLCVFGHGGTEPPYFLGQDKRELLPPSIAVLLRGWVVYGACCNSLCTGADGLVAAGARVIGFNDVLWVPTREELPTYVDRMGLCLQRIALDLHAGASPPIALAAGRDAFRDMVRDLYKAARTFGEQATVVNLNLNRQQLGLR